MIVTYTENSISFRINGLSVSLRAELRQKKDRQPTDNKKGRKRGKITLRPGFCKEFKDALFQPCYPLRQARNLARASILVDHALGDAAHDLGLGGLQCRLGRLLVA